MSKNYAIRILEGEQIRLDDIIKITPDAKDALSVLRLELNIAISDLKSLEDGRTKTALQRGDF